MVFKYILDVTETASV